MALCYVYLACVSFREMNRDLTSRSLLDLNFTVASVSGWSFGLL